jgi:hypothetical protein
LRLAAVVDDILRSSPLVVFVQVAKRLDDYAVGRAATRRDVPSSAWATRSNTESCS